MTTDSTRRRIASHGAPGAPYAHLQPIVDAELGWGNLPGVRRGWYQPDPAHYPGRWSYDLDQPLHVEQLRAAFSFPENVRLGVFAPQAGHRPAMTVGDGRGVGVTAPAPRDWPHGEGFVDLPRTPGQEA